MEEELEQMMQEALGEEKGLDDDTNTDDSEQEESIDESTDNSEDEDNRENIDEDEGSDDSKDDDINENEGDNSSSENEYDDEADTEDNNNKENNSDFEPVEVSVNGQIISLNSQEELLQYVKSGIQSKSPRQRKSENDQIIEQGKLSQEDLALLIDAKSGNKFAIAKLAKDSNIDIYDISDDAASEYQQTFQANIATEVDEVAQDIMEDVELHAKFKSVVANVPQEFATQIATSPDALRNFAKHVKSGLAQKVIPEAMKQQMLHGGSFMENYAKVGREMTESSKAPEKSKTIRKENPRAESLREKAKSQKGANKGTKTSSSGADIWDLSDEDFKKQYM